MYRRHRRYRHPSDRRCQDCNSGHSGNPCQPQAHQPSPGVRIMTWPTTRGKSFQDDRRTYRHPSDRRCQDCDPGRSGNRYQAQAHRPCPGVRIMTWSTTRGKSFRDDRRTYRHPSDRRCLDCDPGRRSGNRYQAQAHRPSPKVRIMTWPTTRGNSFRDDRRAVYQSVFYFHV